MKLLVALLALLQFGPRAPLTPAETLLEPAVLRAIAQPAPADTGDSVTGTDSGSDIVVSCADHQCGTASRAVRKLAALVSAKTLPQPARTIRILSSVTADSARQAAAVVHVAEIADRGPQVVRAPWSTAGIGDEAAEVLARHFAPATEIKSYESLGQPGFDGYGVSTTTIVANPSLSGDAAATIAAATAYFLATLPNAGAEALLSHLTVGAHARLAEDGRKAVAQMGNQQRASADVLIMFGQAIEREQRRMRSFERFMPTPVDPMLRSRLDDMEKGITSLWTSMGITSSPYVPPAQRIRGRGGEDLRVPSRTGSGPIKAAEPPTAFLKFENVNLILFELGNFIDGKRSISDIRDAVSAEFGSLPIPSVTDYFDRLAKSGVITIK